MPISINIDIKMSIWCLLAVVLCCVNVRLLEACSKHCDCRYDGDEVIIGVNCSSRDLDSLPELNDHYETNIAYMDLSNNFIETISSFPEEFQQLTLLNLSRNYITLENVPDLNLLELQQLDLSANNISSWSSLEQFLNSLLTLVNLNLSGNPLEIITSHLKAPNLKTLNLNYCRVAQINAPNILIGLPLLETLSLRHNPLHSVIGLASQTLTTLDLSHGSLEHLKANILQNLPNLVQLKLAHNPRLSLSRRSGETVISDSLEMLDLSYCNMDTVDISGFPNLNAINLRGNRIKSLHHTDFEQNVALENIDLSLNAIAYIAPNAFHQVAMLKNADLSFNMIRNIARRTFVNNNQLTSINLSRNFLSNFSRLSSSSLTHLNLSWCELLAIDEDALLDLPELIDLDLSHNLFSEFPVVLRSRKLQRLDLRMCRIGNIGNATFDGFPKLTQLQLASNRFTTPFRVDFFENNSFLRELRLGDNPWRCECTNQEFYEFFVFINEEPMRLRDAVHLHCFSPEEVYGLDWHTACANSWNARTLNETSTSRVTLTLLILLFAGIVLLCLIRLVKHWQESRKRKINQLETDENLALTRETMRLNQTMLEQNAQQNAPNPRESHPPCYDDALLLPKFTGSFASLKGRWIASDDESDTVDTSMPLRNRCRSEEVLSHRESIVDQQRQIRRQVIAEANQRYSIYPNFEITRRSPDIQVVEISYPLS